MNLAISLLQSLELNIKLEKLSMNSIKILIFLIIYVYENILPLNMSVM